MITRLWVCRTVVAVAAVLASHAVAAPRPTLAEPSLSPDGAEIAFVSGGDIWTVPAAGGTASLLVTGARTLIDGSALRVPFIRIDGVDGQNMERNPRSVDLTVERQLGETLAGADAQLDAAVAELLKGLGAKR